MNKSSTVNLTGVKTVEIQQVTGKTYADVVAEKNSERTNFLPYESSNSKEPVERIEE